MRGDLPNRNIGRISFSEKGWLIFTRSFVETGPAVSLGKMRPNISFKTPAFRLENTSGSLPQGLWLGIKYHLGYLTSTAPSAERLEATATGVRLCSNLVRMPLTERKIQLLRLFAFFSRSALGYLVRQKISRGYTKTLYN